MKHLVKYILKFFKSVDLFEAEKKIKFKLSNNYKFYKFNSLRDIKLKEIDAYFKEFKEKKKRFNKGCYFLTLIYKKKLVSSGWLFEGNVWNIEEIDKNIFIKKKYLIFDFFTIPSERGKGHYTNLLKIIRRKFQDKKIIIYSLSSNFKSKRAIVSAGFKFKGNLKNFSK